MKSALHPLGKDRINLNLRKQGCWRGLRYRGERWSDWRICRRKVSRLTGMFSGPAVDTENQRFSFDHHGECVRLVTRATCQQIMDALLLGFDPKGYTVYVNDVDGDTALSVWLLNNPSRVFETDVRKLVESVGMIDAHGPAYPVERSGDNRCVLQRRTGVSLRPAQKKRVHSRRP